MSLGSIPSYLLRVVASWLVGCFCIIVWWFMYLVINDNQRGLGELMTWFLYQADINLKVIISFSLPVGIVVGEILAGIWEVLVGPLFEHAKDNATRAINFCSKPFEYFVTSLGDKFKAETYDRNKKANITIAEFASIFNQEKAYNASEIHFALARCLGGISIGLTGGLILVLLLLVNFFWKNSGKSKRHACDLFCAAVSICSIIVGWVAALYLCEVKGSLIMAAIIALIFIPISLVAFYQSLRYRDFANFIIIISKSCNAQLGKTKI